MVVFAIPMRFTCYRCPPPPFSRERIQASVSSSRSLKWHLATWLPFWPSRGLSPVLLSYGSSSGKFVLKLGVQMQRGHCSTNV